jgi:hypothetical protein
MIAELIEVLLNPYALMMIAPGVCLLIILPILTYKWGYVKGLKTRLDRASMPKGGKRR